MSFDAKYVQPGDSIDYTPTSAVPAGAIVIQSGLVGVAKLDIPANTLGALAVSGLFDVKKTTVAISAGAKVYWNATSSFATNVASGNTYIGLAAQDVTSGGAVVKVLLNK
jgi:predicted RecA/RadA family phage recombinase